MKQAPLKITVSGKNSRLSVVRMQLSSWKLLSTDAWSLVAVSSSTLATSDVHLTSSTSPIWAALVEGGAKLVYRTSIWTAWNLVCRNSSRTSKLATDVRKVQITSISHETRYTERRYLTIPNFLTFFEHHSVFVIDLHLLMAFDTMTLFYVFTQVGACSAATVPTQHTCKLPIIYQLQSNRANSSSSLQMKVFVTRLVKCVRKN